MSPSLDRLDKDLIRLLQADGRVPTARLAEQLAVTTPTIRSRLRTLMQRGILRVAGMVNQQQAPGLSTALIGINIESRGKLAEQLQALTALPQVHWAAVVTGRFDIIAEVALTKGVEELFNFTSRILPSIGRVTHSETFVVMRASNKWVCMPGGLAQW